VAPGLFSPSSPRMRPHSLSPRPLEQFGLSPIAIHRRRPDVGALDQWKVVHRHHFDVPTFVDVHRGRPLTTRSCYKRRTQLKSNVGSLHEARPWHRFRAPPAIGQWRLPQPLLLLREDGPLPILWRPRPLQQCLTSTVKSLRPKCCASAAFQESSTPWPGWRCRRMSKRSVRAHIGEDGHQLVWHDWTTGRSQGRIKTI
jgi:hypothetical protein